MSFKILQFQNMDKIQTRYQLLLIASFYIGTTSMSLLYLILTFDRNPDTNIRLDLKPLKQF